ncbi:hypothetical protein GCM10010387_28870 [Streptomyces inusitatus]|uniref:Toxin-antitoxin system, toxin component n=2 Tax=Streptomyces inusitatus TaxID=68221 RepID=A0A918Q6X1_9ACTN|nr:hypothetical protein GCM10010387_28870 [Streptomyces inusitatus]
MRQLRDELARALDQADPAGPDEVFAALCARLGEHRGRPVLLRFVDFPPGTASGLYLDMTDRDVICVQASTHPVHQLIIFGHEVWHMVAGHTGHHGGGAAAAARSGPAGPAAAARLVTGEPGGPCGPAGDELKSAVRQLAARTGFRQAQETEAETFGLELGAQLRGWLERRPATTPRSPVAQRIQDSLGHRQV